MTKTQTGGAEVQVLDDAGAVARAAAERLTEELRATIDRRGEAHLALTGGSAAVELYEELVLHGRESVDWERVHLWWGDERFVPIDHPESNIGMAYSILLAMGARAGESGSGGQTADIEAHDLPSLDVRPENIHPFQIDEALSESDAADLVAERYAEEMERFLPTRKGDLPAFDVVLLGVGGDGHIMSVFPGSDALEPDSPLVLAVPAPDHIGPHLPRITLNPRLLTAAGRVIVMVTGEDKAEAVSRAFGAREEVGDVPARLAVRPNATWFLDQAAADQLAS